MKVTGFTTKKTSDVVFIVISIMMVVGAGLSSARADDGFLPGVGVTDYEPMKPFEPYAGKVWMGTGEGPDGKPVTDIAHWEFILGGRALQVTHSIDDGTYGGRTIYFYDEGEQKYLFHYFTTAGFHTLGEVNILDDGLEAIETVKGHETIRQVRGVLKITEGRMVSSSSYLTDEGWVEGHGFDYQQTGRQPLFTKTPVTVGGQE